MNSREIITFMNRTTVHKVTLDGNAIDSSLPASQWEGRTQKQTANPNVFPPFVGSWRDDPARYRLYVESTFKGAGKGQVPLSAQLFLFLGGDTVDNELRGLSPWANYTDWANGACRRS
jgi:hypothetical protein